MKKTDLEIAEEFFNMLKRNGVNIDEKFDEGKEFIINTEFQAPVNSWETLTFCFNEGKYSRIMGYLGDYYCDEIHKN